VSAAGYLQVCTKQEMRTDLSSLTSSQPTTLLVPGLVGSFSAQECSSPTSWLSPPRTPQAAYLWHWTRLRHPLEVGGCHHCSEYHAEERRRVPDMSGRICTFVLCLNSKARAEKRSEVETGLDSFRRRCAGLGADAGLAGVWPISDNGLARSGMFDLVDSAFGSRVPRSRK
jgi:hypothetical protein